VALCQRFGTFVKGKGAIPMLVVMPEIFDLESVRTGNRFYAPLIEALKSEIHVVDLASTLLDCDDQIYTHAIYGGHYSPQANRRIADALRPLCATLLSKSPVNCTLVCPT